ncbi:copper resistance protein CopB [Gammaproteobacteria bacterium 45_16_T64]|nr:copper resistance protein CopB [Gammaproteobacteria bacterium 45_16_T64]
MRSYLSAATLSTVLLLPIITSTQAMAASKDDPIVSTVIVDQLEIRDSTDDDPLIIEAQGWIGQDLHKLWFKADVEHVDGETEEAELQALYSKAFTPFWDIQAGVRRDFKPTPGRNWAVFGFQGLSPYFLEIDTALFIGEGGRTALRLAAEYELMLTQQWVLSPDVSINFYGKDDEDTGVGAGLADAEVGLRIRYEIRREIAPYAGIVWQSQYGKSADYTREEGGDVSDTQFILGIRAWY